VVAQLEPAPARENQKTPDAWLCASTEKCGPSTCRNDGALDLRRYPHNCSSVVRNRLFPDASLEIRPSAPIDGRFVSFNLIAVIRYAVRLIPVAIFD
jgi:hypothetical protein